MTDKPLKELLAEPPWSVIQAEMARRLRKLDARHDGVKRYEFDRNIETACSCGTGPAPCPERRILDGKD